MVPEVVSSLSLGSSRSRPLNLAARARSAATGPPERFQNGGFRTGSGVYDGG